MALRRSRFSGHQTFPFRYGWLEKGCQLIQSGRQFSDTDALVYLGVGKNMVESIRYWCDIFGLIDEGGLYSGLSTFAKKLLDAQTGWDPCLEDDASLWLLHWRMCSQQQVMTAASLLFGEMHKPEFNRQEWLELLRQRDSQTQGKATSTSTLERDMECCIKMYVAQKTSAKKRVQELSFACPFQELGLLSTSEGGTMLRFSIGYKAGLAPEIIGYAIWDYATTNNRHAMSLNELMYADYAPGQVFMLDENSLVEAIMHLHESDLWSHAFNLTSSEGIETVHCNLSNGNTLLNTYYNVTE